MSDYTSKTRQQGWGKLFLLLVLSAAAAAVYVSKVNSEQTPAADAAMPPPPVAEVITIKQEKVRIWTRFSGRLSAVDQAEIKPLVGGELQQVLFEDGQEVKKGQLLVKMDPAASKAELEKVRSQEIALTLNKERLEAYLAKKPANLLKWSQAVINSKYNTVERSDEIKLLLEKEKEE